MTLLKDAKPYPVRFETDTTALLLIDMQRDFLEPGGFGEMLGNDVSLLRGTIEPCRALLLAARATNMSVLHTREGHRPDLSDAPPSKIARGNPPKRIGELGPMGRILIRGQPGHAIIPELAPLPVEPVIDKPGKGAFYQTDLHLMPATQTGDPVRGWEAGLTWVFIQSFVLIIGGFIAPVIRKITPRAALLGTLAGVSIAFISMRPELEMFMTPTIGVLCFAVILAGWFGGVRYFGGIPAGLVAIAVGSVVAWGSTALGLNYGGMSLEKLGESVANFGFSVPLPAVGHVFSGFEFLGVLLVTAIPFGIYDLVEAMDNVESAAVAGDSFPTTRVLTADGVVSLIGCLMGNPFINAVYIGHPGWKAMGGRIGYSAATGIMVILLSWLGIIALMMALIPVVAIAPILLYIGMLIGAQAFQETPKSHAPAIVLALTPHVAAWGKLQIDNALAAAGTSAAAVGIEKLRETGVLYEGLAVLGGGAILSGLILSAVAVFVIERQLLKAGAFALAGSVLTFFGFIHGEAIGVGQTPLVASSYLAVAILLIACAKFAVPVPKPAETAELEAEHAR